MTVNGRGGKAERARFVEDLRKMIRSSAGMVFVDMKGLDSAETLLLRRTVRQAKSRLKVVKNRLMRIACEREKVAGCGEWLRSNTAVVFTGEEPLPAIKAITAYAVEHEKLKLKGALIEGRLVERDGLGAVAALPGRVGLLGMAATAMKGPLVRAVRDFRWVYVRMALLLKEAARKVG